MYFAHTVPRQDVTTFEIKCKCCSNRSVFTKSKIFRRFDYVVLCSF